jgi:polyisoprenoid-binding protein YceI
MNLRVCFFLVLVCFGFSARSQKYTLEKSLVIFFSDATIEDIRAENIRASSIFNISTGEVVFSVPISDFEFEKELMKEHFNEKYLETEKFPRAIFQGKFLNVKSDQIGEQVVNASGKLTIHGVTKAVNFPGTLDITPNQIIARSKFMIRLEDYKIKIPQLVWQNIAEEVEVTVEFYYKPQ